MMHDYTYFYTASIHNFKHILAKDSFKMIVINSLKYLVNNKLATIYAYVIMPNHIHLIWRINKLNRVESPSGSFLKFTSHEFKKTLLATNNQFLKEFMVDEYDRKYRFWQDDSLAISITSEKALLQKMNYIHLNPCKEKWHLAKSPEEYLWSSASFYLGREDSFSILTDYRD